MGVAENQISICLSHIFQKEREKPTEMADSWAGMPIDWQLKIPIEIFHKYHCKKVDQAK